MSNSVPVNGHFVDAIPSIAPYVHAGSSTDLFVQLALMASAAGREDLAYEFTQRAAICHAAPLLAPVSSRTRILNSDADRHHKEGCRLVREGKLAEAEVAFRQAIRLDPASADAHGNLGVALGQLRRLPEAEAAFHIAIRIDPVVPTMYINLATCLLQQGKFGEVEGWARQAIQLNPELAEAHRLLGCSLDARNKLEPAETALRDAVHLDPRNADAHFRLGTVLARREQPKDAEASLREAVRIKPALAPAWASLANLLGSLDRHTEAADAAREAAKLDPTADHQNTLGVALAGVEKYAEAEIAYREAIRLNPKLATAHSNLGNALRSLGRIEDGVSSLREALRLRPNYPEAHNNLGIALVQMGRDDEGMKSYDEAIRMAPDYPEAHMNRSLAWLANGEFERGWPEYEWRWKVKPFKGKPEPGPRWDGSAIIDKTILVSAEQGLGDAIQFIRYAPLVKARGATVVIDSPVAIASLLATCPGVDKVVPRGQPGPKFDYYMPMLSLPGIFGVPPAAATATVPYFRPDPERVAFWRDELAAVPGLKVGIAWQGSKAHKGDKLRSVPLTRFAPLAAVPGVSLCSLQKGPGSEQLTEGAGPAMGIIDLGAKIASELADAAALMMNLDLIVSVDTAVIHLAGALGRPVWVALPSAADWRWLRSGDETPWYPTLRLYRQTMRGEWDAVFGRIAVSLAAASKAKGEGRWNSDPLAVAEVASDGS